LHPVIEDCAATVTELKSILEKVAISPSDPGWKKSFKALASCFHDKEVAAIEASLSQSLTVINQYHGAYTATTTGAILKKLTAAVASIPEKSDTSDQVPVRHFMVPTIWSDDFSGRQEIMIRLENVLSESDNYRRVAIVGLGGVGGSRMRLGGRGGGRLFWVEVEVYKRIRLTSKFPLPAK
jgi:hypothetical protein